MSTDLFVCLGYNTLEILEHDDDWGADTLDAIASMAYQLGLATSDRHSRFKIAATRPRKVRPGDLYAGEAAQKHLFRLRHPGAPRWQCVNCGSTNVQSQWSAWYHETTDYDLTLVSDDTGQSRPDYWYCEDCEHQDDFIDHGNLPRARALRAIAAFKHALEAEAQSWK